MDLALSNISIMQILIFLTVVNEKGFAKAAVQLHMTQPAITKSIAKMEQELGLKLFERTTRSIDLMESGRKLYEVWKPCIEEMQKCYHSAYTALHQEDTVINIAFINTTRPELYLQSTAERFQQRYPNIELNIVADSLENQWEFFFQHKYDIIFIPDFEQYEMDRLHLSWKWAAHSPVQILVPKSHRLAGFDRLTLDDIRDEVHVIVDSSRNPNYLRYLTSIYETKGLKPKTGKTYHSTNAIRSIRRLNGLLLVDDFIDFQDTGDLRKIPLDGFCNGIICTWHEPFRTNYIRQFVEMIQPSE